MCMKNVIRYITGIQYFAADIKGRVLLYLIAFVPMVYKLLSPFFIIAGLSEFTFIIMPVLTVAGIILARHSIRVSVHFLDYCVYLLFLVVLILSPMLYPNTQILYEENFETFAFSVLPFLFIGLLIDYKKDFFNLRFVARLGVFVQLFLQLCKIMGLVETELGTEDSLGEQMEAAYQLLFPILILYISISREFIVIDLLLAFIGTVLLFLMGARGPIVVYGIFMMGYFVFFKKYQKCRFLKKGVVVALFGLFYYYLNIIVLAILPLAANLGFSTRVFDSILDDRMVNINESSDRDAFYGNVLREIQNDNGFGHGWLSDRLFTPDGMYVHNFELEVLCQFGYIFGGAILLLLLVLLFRSYVYCKNERTIEFWYVMLCAGFFALQFSYSYIKYPLFFVFVGFLMSKNRKV